MKNLLERLNFSIEKPQEYEEYICFKLKLTSPPPTYGMFSQLCCQAKAHLYRIEDSEFEKCLGVFTAFSEKAKQEMENRGTSYLICHFWVEEE